MVNAHTPPGDRTHSTKYSQPHYLVRFPASSRRRIVVERAAMARLQAHGWPGNIRELRNVLDRARLFVDDGVVRAEHLPDGLGSGARPAARPVSVATAAVPVWPDGSARAGTHPARRRWHAAHLRV